MLFIQCRLIMRKILILFAVALIVFASCADSKQSMTVTVTNSLALERAGEMVEVPMSDVVAKLKLADTAQEAKPIKATANRINIFLIISLH